MLYYADVPKDMAGLDYLRFDCEIVSAIISSAIFPFNLQAVLSIMTSIFFITLSKG